MSKVSRLFVVCLFALLGIGCNNDASDGKQDGDGSSPKTLIVYCSVTGNTEAAAKALAETLGADIEKLRVNDPEPVTATRLYAMHDAGVNLASIRWSIKPLSHDPTQYDRIILGGPVWYGSPSSVLTSFVEGANLSGKTAIVFLTMQQAENPQALKALADRVGARSATVVSSFTLSATVLGGQEGIAQKAREIGATLKH